MKKFWNWVRNDDGERVLRLEGPIDEDDFWGDTVTPQMFREELEAEEGDITVWINSPGGNVFCAAEIYTMLCDHKGKITVKIDAIAASAASVVAMAGDRVLMSPVGMIFVHDPMTVAMGNTKDMEKAISTLNEVKASIINAYQKKTGLSRNKISQLMENETWMNAKKKKKKKIADEILFEKQGEPERHEAEEENDDGKEIEAVWQTYSTRVMGQTILNRLGCTAEAPAPADDKSVEDSADTEAVEPAEAGVKETVRSEEEELKDADKRKKSGTGASSDGNKDGDDSHDDPDGDDSPDDPDVPDEDDPDFPDDPDAPDTDDAPEENTGGPVAETTEETEDENSKVPVIGMDGKTKDGAMPYEILKKQLDFLK